MPLTKTDLIDRYLQAVKLWLPWKQQKDILAEIAEDLQSQVDDREATLGRPLEEADVVALLKQRGSPMRVAAGFIPEHRLINPAMLPLYQMVLKIVLLWVLAPLFAIVFVAPIFDSGRPGPALLAFFGEGFRALFLVIGIVTTIFALLDRYHSKWVDRWDPRKLPRVPPAQQSMQWYNDFASFAFGMAGLVFWAVMMWHRSAFVLNSGFRIILEPIWGRIYWVILGLTLAQALVDLYAFLRPVWSSARSWMRLAIDGAGFVLLVALLRVGNWVNIAGTNLTTADGAKIVSLVNTIIQISPICGVLVPLIDAFRQLRRLYRSRSGRPATMATMA